MDVAQKIREADDFSLVMRMRLISIRAMYVCVCKTINDRMIKEAHRNGARSVDELKNGLGVGSNCGRCVDYAARILADLDQGSKPSTSSLSDTESQSHLSGHHL